MHMALTGHRLRESATFAMGMEEKLVAAGDAGFVSVE